MLALNHKQLELVMAAAGGLVVEKRDLFLQRVAARLALHGHRASSTPGLSQEIEAPSDLAFKGA